VTVRLPLVTTLSRLGAVSRQSMPDAVHVAGESDIHSVLPYVKTSSDDVGVSADILRREIGGDVEQPVQLPKLFDGGVDELRERGFLNAGKASATRGGIPPARGFGRFLPARIS
jgi:hypothetical protein